MTKAENSPLIFLLLLISRYRTLLYLKETAVASDKSYKLQWMYVITLRNDRSIFVTLVGFEHLTLSKENLTNNLHPDLSNSALLDKDCDKGRVFSQVDRVRRRGSLRTLTLLSSVYRGCEKPSVLLHLQLSGWITRKWICDPQRYRTGFILSKICAYEGNYTHHCSTRTHCWLSLSLNRTPFTWYCALQGMCCFISERFITTVNGKKQFIPLMIKMQKQR